MAAEPGLEGEMEADAEAEGLAAGEPGPDGPVGDGPMGDGPMGDGPMGDGPMGEDAAAMAEAGMAIEDAAWATFTDAITSGESIDSAMMAAETVAMDIAGTFGFTWKTCTPGFLRWIASLMTFLGGSAIRINAIPSSRRVKPVSPAGDSRKLPLRVDFDRRLKLEFLGSKITQTLGSWPVASWTNVLGLTDLAGAALSDLRRGKNTRHLLTGLLRQSVFGRLAGYEDVNDAERLSRDPAMRAIVGSHGS